MKVLNIIVQEKKKKEKKRRDSETKKMDFRNKMSLKKKYFFFKESKQSKKQKPTKTDLSKTLKIYFFLFHSIKVRTETLAIVTKRISRFSMKPVISFVVLPGILCRGVRHWQLSLVYLESSVLLSSLVLELFQPAEHPGFQFHVIFFGQQSPQFAGKSKF